MERFLTGLSWDGESPEVLWNEWLDWRLFNWLLLPLLLRGWSFLEYQRVRHHQNLIPFMLAIRKPLLIKILNKSANCPKLRSTSQFQKAIKRCSCVTGNGGTKLEEI